ncbi:replication factor A protein 2 [Metarhizium rileyi]|uniref:Replication factor A protein 2 n=1 Tax=Metarhizium rileyi (strain RCEF 4871) TaxID=1649241 RepID=A0A5C6GIB0_METRR|nr:replication factor A protein 2 [Metarhizium rileyi]
MSAYAGYTKTSYGAQGGDDSGGFFAGGSQTGSQGGGKSYQDESLRPVTIKQVLEAEEAFAGADFKIDNTTITQITFVGQVRHINPQPTNVTFKIDDGTGHVEVKKWIDADKQDDANADQYELDSYVRVWGRLKSFSNKRHVAAHVIRPVTDFNEVNYHLLEATYVHLYFTKGPLGQEGVANGGGDGMFVDGGGYGGANGGGGQMPNKLSSCSPSAKKMFNFMNGAPGMNEGIHLNVISSSANLSVRDVLSAADELLGQGLIYTTVDDETWAILEY